MNIPPGMNNCQEKKEFVVDKVEDEQHFIITGMKLNENLRQDLFSNLELKLKHIQLWNETEKVKYFFETASESDLQKFAKFVSNSFEKHRKYSNKAQIYLNR